MPKENSFFLLLGRFTSRRGIPQSSRLLGFCLFSLFLLLLDFCRISYIISWKNYLIELSLPTKCFAHKIIEIPKIIYNYVDLKKENKELRLELDKLKLNSVVTAELESELKHIRELLNLKYQSNSFNFIEKVLGFDSSIYDSFLLISATQIPTQKNSLVISADGLVGIISEVHNDIAKVIPITNSKVYIPVKNNSGERLILCGTGKNNLFSIEIQSNSVKYFHINDILYTSGDGGIYREGIPVAKITKINPDKVRVYAKPITDLGNLAYVWIISSLAF